MCKKVIYIINNRGPIDNLKWSLLEQLEKIVMGLSKKMDTNN